MKRIILAALALCLLGSAVFATTATPVRPMVYAPDGVTKSLVGTNPKVVGTFSGLDFYYTKTFMVMNSAVAAYVSCTIEASTDGTNYVTIDASSLAACGPGVKKQVTVNNAFPYIIVRGAASGEAGTPEVWGRFLSN